MTADKHKLVVAHAIGGPLEVILKTYRLVVLVSAEERNVEVVARVLEVVWVPTEEGNGELRREDQPYVVVFLVLIKVIDRARVERDHIAAQPGGLVAFSFKLRLGSALGG